MHTLRGEAEKHVGHLYPKARLGPLSHYEGVHTHGEVQRVELAS